MDDTENAHSRPDIVAKINLAIDHVSLHLSQALIAVATSDAEHRDRHGITLRTVLQEQLPLFAHSPIQQDIRCQITPADLGSEKAFDDVCGSIQQGWAGAVQCRYKQVWACCQEDLLQSVNVAQDLPSPVKTKMTKAIEALLSASFAQAEEKLRELAMLDLDKCRIEIEEDPAIVKEYRHRFLSLDFDPLLPVTPLLQRSQLPPTPPSSTSSKRPANEDLESPRRKKHSQPSFLEDLADQIATHRLRLLDIHINFCLDRLCQGYANIIRKAFRDIANSDLADEIRSRVSDCSGDRYC